ncbi:hypothetical protein OC846_006401 [Tilletia horrida]|uniref:Uncharacterized protein n=1 Tax=Tilletia horrida TaxID=155126 RepID=A0AAN6JPD4_9BASI|nr:hypothetical protein OC846_006401 [Tilletia horrida]
MPYDPDPFNRAAGPPRHNVESDSEDEEYDPNPKPSSSSSSAAQASITFKPSGTTSSPQHGKPLLIVLAPALNSGPGASSGAALASALTPFAQLPTAGTFDLDLDSGAAAQASLSEVHTSNQGVVNVILLAPDLDASQHPTMSLLAREIIQSVQPSSPHSAPILPYDVPNALTGIDGALFLQATLRDIPITAIFQPFEMLDGLQHGAVDPIFPLDPAQTGSTALPLLIRAALSLSQPLGTVLSASASSKSATDESLSGSFLRLRKRRRLQEEAGVHLLKGEQGKQGRQESNMYV